MSRDRDFIVRTEGDKVREDTARFLREASLEITKCLSDLNELNSKLNC